ncbi:MAG: hypothetical protein QM736_25280 [Vicinamibacterales bacterium]
MEVLHFTQRETRLDTDHTVDACERFLQETFVGGDVGDDDAEQVVGVARHQIALEHFRPLHDRLLERIEPSTHLQIERDLDEHGDVATHRVRIQQGDVSLDDASPLERLHAPEAGRRREPDAVREIHVGDPRVLLDVAKQRVVDFVEFEISGVRHMNDVQAAGAT